MANHHASMNVAALCRDGRHRIAGALRQTSRLVAFAVFALLATPGIASAQKVEARLLADVSAAHPGATFTVGVHLVIENGWYIYWLNPGDAGIPTQVEWELPNGVTAEPLQWPAPTPHREGELVSYGYEREVLLSSRLRVPAGLDAEAIDIKAHVTWLACRDICVPGEARVDLRLPVRSAPATSPPAEAAILRRFHRLVPVRSPGWVFAVRDRTLTLTPPPGFDVAAWRTAVFLALDPELTDHAGAPRWSSAFWGLRTASLKVPLAPGRPTTDTVRGVLLRSPDDPRGALEIEALPKQ